MTEADRRFWERVQRRAAALQLDVARALLRSFAILRASLSEAELARLIAQDALSRLIADAFSDEVLARSFIPYRRAIHRSAERGFELATRDLPRAGKVGDAIAVHYDPIDPKVITAVRQLEARFVDRVKVDVRESVMAHVQHGLQANLPPRAIARTVPDVIGLGEAQVTQIEHARVAAVRAAEATSITAPPTPAQIDRTAARQRTERVATNVAATSETAALQSYKSGQTLAWQQAREAGLVGDGEVMKQWLQVDRPSKRLSHARMNRQIVPFDAPYSNGQMIPGEDPEDYYCACVSKVFVRSK